MYIGIDLGGTKIAAAAVNVLTGAIIGRGTIPTQSQEGPEAVLARMVALVHAICLEARVSAREIKAIGVGVPGVFDLEQGETLFLPNLAGTWPGVPVGPTLSSAFGCPARLINDARAFVLAEATFGAGRGARTVVGITIGTGIGGGIAFDGRLYLGLDGTAGEVGHQTIDPDGPICGCGNQGCLETFASGPAIAARGVRAMLRNRAAQIGTLVDHNPARVTPEVILRAAEAGDDDARAILLESGYMLGIGVANLVTILSPDCVVIGGSVSGLGEWLFGPVREAVKQRCRAIPVAKVLIVPAALGGDAGVVGAAVWASQYYPNNK